jgi:hypothetical protein
MTGVEEAKPAVDTFAAERSHKDSTVANETARASAQAAILINGGAATAVLAFMGKDTLDPGLLRMVSGCLAIYAVGVFFGALTLFSMMNAVNWWNMSWEAVARGYGEVEQKSADRVANSWMRGAHGCFLAAMLCFVFSSLLIAGAVAMHAAPVASR